MEQDVANPLIPPRAVVENYFVAELKKDPQLNHPFKANIVREVQWKKQPKFSINQSNTV
jgi:hypothetical protein